MGLAREIALFGARGDRKTTSALIAMVAHAMSHAKAGYPLPVRWMGVADTYQSHRLKTIRSMQAHHWGGAWRFSDDYHTASLVVDSAEWVRIDLFGVEDIGAIDRLRMECHGVWFEEPAPVAVMVSSSGISETAWLTALTSQRLATHRHVAIMTLNYPDADHWTWQRFIAKPNPGTLAFRIPPGENASAADREEWARALAGRPDLMRRLLLGEPGVISMGPQVALGFREDLHVAKSSLAVTQGEPLILGWDGGHCYAQA